MTSEEPRDFATTSLTITEQPDDSATAADTPSPKRPKNRWMFVLPACGCIVAVLLCLGGAGAFIVGGRGVEIARQLGIATVIPQLQTPTATPTVVGSPTAAARSTPAADGQLVIKLLKVGRIGPSGLRDNEGKTVFDPDNRGFAAQVQYVQVPRGRTGRVAMVWERIEGSSIVQVRQPDYYQFDDTSNDTTWWYTLRSETGLPAGSYQVTLALPGVNNALDRVATIKFEVNASR